MLMDGYMLTGRVGLGSHKRVEDELFIIWYVYAKLKLKKIVDTEDIMPINEIFTIVPSSHHYYPKDVLGGEKPWLQSKADLKKW